MYRMDRFDRKKEYLKYTLPYARIIHEPAIVLNKDGSLQTTWKYRGPDLNSAIREQLAIITQQLNTSFQGLDTGWVLYFEAQRVASKNYATDVFFPDIITKAMDEERKNFFADGKHFESNYYATAYWMPPNDQEGKIRELVVDEQFELFVLIKNADVRVAKNGKKFIAFTFQDTSGTIDGKYWDASEEEINKFTAGTVVFLSGKREIYQGNPQVKILHMRLTKLEEPSDPSFYMERAPLKKEEMEEEINQKADRIPEQHGFEAESGKCIRETMMKRLILSAKRYVKIQNLLL